MVEAIILAGGTGTRLGTNIPKQYLTVNEKPVIAYCLERFEEHSLVNSIVIVAAEEWQDYILEWIEKENITKFAGFAKAGTSRQHSIFHGLQKLKENGALDMDTVIVHDSVRPNVSEDIITACINELQNADGVMPVLPVKDTVYLSKTGKSINSLLNRDELFAGQAPESFKFGKYYSIHERLTDEEMNAVRGTSEIAYRNGMEIRLVPGDEKNYKITTVDDLEKFKLEIER